MDVEADVAELVGSTQSGDAHTDRTRPDRLAIGVEIDFAPDHQFHGTVRRQLIDWQLLYELSVPKYGDSIGDPKDLLEPVTDEHHCHALGAQVLDHGKQARHLTNRQRRRRLVENQNIGSRRQGFADFNELLLRRVESTGKIHDVALQTQRRQDLVRSEPHVLVVDATAGQGGQVPEEHVLGDREIGEQAGILVNCSNSVPAQRRWDGGALSGCHRPARGRRQGDGLHTES